MFLISTFFSFSVRHSYIPRQLRPELPVSVCSKLITHGRTDRDEYLVVIVTRIESVQSAGADATWQNLTALFHVFDPLPRFLP